MESVKATEPLTHQHTATRRVGMSMARRALIVLGGLALVSLGALAPIHRAGADPIGMSVSGGSNPIVSITGMLSTNALTTLYTVPPGKLFVITDIHVTGYSATSDLFRLYDATGAKYVWAGFWYHATTQTNPGLSEAQQQFTTGLTLSAGTTLQAQTSNCGAGCQTNFYTITGYLARP
jgi:hypothetical protein